MNKPIKHSVVTSSIIKYCIDTITQVHYQDKWTVTTTNHTWSFLSMLHQYDFGQGKQTEAEDAFCTPQCWMCEWNPPGCKIPKQLNKTITGNTEVKTYLQTEYEFITCLWTTDWSEELGWRTEYKGNHSCNKWEQRIISNPHQLIVIMFLKRRKYHYN